MKNFGWICPKCGRAYAPFVAECTFCANEAKKVQNWNQVEHIYRPENGPTCDCNHDNINEVAHDCKCVCEESDENPVVSEPHGTILVKRYKDGKEVESKNYTFEDLFGSLVEEIQAEKEARENNTPKAQKTSKNFEDVIEEALTILKR